MKANIEELKKSVNLWERQVAFVAPEAMAEGYVGAAEDLAAAEASLAYAKRALAEAEREARLA